MGNWARKSTEKSGGRRPQRTSGGRAGASGHGFQARVIAYLAVHVLDRRKIGWLGNRGSDIPEALAAETDCPGDDIGVELANTDIRLEAQVKRGVSGKAKLTGALRIFVDRLPVGAAIEGILVVDPHAPATITRDLREDLGRIRHGRRDGLREMALAVLEMLTRANALHVAEHLEVVPVAVDRDRIQSASSS